MKNDNVFQQKSYTFTTSLLNDCEEILKITGTIIKTLKNHNS